MAFGLINICKPCATANAILILSAALLRELRGESTLDAHRWREIEASLLPTSSVISIDEDMGCVSISLATNGFVGVWTHHPVFAIAALSDSERAMIDVAGVC